MKVLISAYACEPGKGSEPGAGWNWTLAAARKHEVWVMTRANNRAAIEEALSRDPKPSLHFVYLELPRWARFWKRGQRGVRLYYALWQVLAGIEARRLHAQKGFDVVHHVTFANLWYPALIYLTGAPFVLGPVGGGVRVPVRLYRSLGMRGAAYEAWRAAAYGASRLNPLVRAGWRRAAVIVVRNEETRKVLPRRYRQKVVVRPDASVSESLPAARARKHDRPTAAYAGRLVPWKGVSLAIRALRLVPSWNLLVIGRGSDERRLRRLVRTSGLEERVRFLRWLPREALWKELASCEAFVLPSLREDASFVAVESLALGLPVVAFDRAGPAALGGISPGSFEFVAPGSETQCIRGLAEALARLAPPRSRAATTAFGLDGVARDLAAIYARVGGAQGESRVRVAA